MKTKREIEERRQSALRRLSANKESLRTCEVIGDKEKADRYRRLIAMREGTLSTIKWLLGE